jgi:hypothetical protein
MAGVVHVDEMFTVGEAFFASPSPSGEWGVVFEDDGDTGYLYATKWNHAGAGGPAEPMDALHIYNAANVTDRAKPSRLKLLWTETGSAAALLLNGYLHAIFDLGHARCFCRNNFPPPHGKSPFRRDEVWDPQLLEQFRPRKSS